MNDWKQALDRQAQAAEDNADRESEVGQMIRGAIERDRAERQTQYCTESDDLKEYRVAYFLAKRVGFDQFEKCVTLEEHMVAVDLLLTALRHKQEATRNRRLVWFLVLAFLAFFVGSAIRAGG